MELPFSKNQDVLKNVLIKYNLLHKQYIIKQNNWRKKQFSIYYKKGRPIFDNFKTQDHIFYKLNNGKYVGHYL